ncbi:DUF982 domain-containing protein [Tropicibacter alexandrii]|uniref:DUF982 domain-containing protein n=1 Tax=Tropicibacter alexandrii TaxID=2267683 RepID=UPI00197CDBA5|nr:DUF982 domain-containing protein [Tropicibacter alexandrii]
MMEIQWGQPMTLIAPQDGRAERFSTIEKARYWLRRKWPVSDETRDIALDRIDAAMDCMRPVEDARHAFLVAALRAGFRPDRLHAA